MFRDVAQLGSALRSGRRGRRFKSCHPEFFQICSSAGSHEITILINWILRIVDFPMYGCKTHSSSTATQNPVIPNFLHKHSTSFLEIALFSLQILHFDLQI